MSRKHRTTPPSARLMFGAAAALLAFALPANGETITGTTLTEDFESSTVLDNVPDQPQGNGVAFNPDDNSWDKDSSTQIDFDARDAPLLAGVRAIRFNGRSGTGNSQGQAIWEYNFSQTYDFTSVTSVRLSIYSDEPAGGSGGTTNWWEQLDVMLLDSDGDIHARTDMHAPAVKNSWEEVTITASDAREPDISGLRFEFRREVFRPNQNFEASFDDFEAQGVSVVPEPGAYALVAGLGSLLLVMVGRRRRS